MPISQYYVLTRPCHTDFSDYPQETGNSVNVALKNNSGLIKRKKEGL